MSRLAKGAEVPQGGGEEEWDVEEEFFVRAARYQHSSRKDWKSGGSYHQGSIDFYLLPCIPFANPTGERRKGESVPLQQDGLHQGGEQVWPGMVRHQTQRKR